MNSKVAGRALAAARDNLATNVRSLESEAVLAQLEQPDAILKMYRSIDAPGYAVQVYRSDRGPALAEPSPQQYGRRYVGYWETCNLHMVANMRAVLAPRSRNAAIHTVGASHSEYYEHISTRCVTSYWWISNACANNQRLPCSQLSPCEGR